MFKIAAAALIALGLTPYFAPPASAQDTAQRAELVVAEMTVETVDMETRQVLLRNADGSVFVFTAGPEVRNLAQVESADKVRVSYFEAVALKMADPADPGGGVAVMESDRAPEGAKPAAAAGVVTDMVVEFVSYEPDSAIATFIGPDGVVHSVVVHPKMRDFAAARTAGDRVQMTMERAMAVEVSPL